MNSRGFTDRPGDLAGESEGECGGEVSMEERHQNISKPSSERRERERRRSDAARSADDTRPLQDLHRNLCRRSPGARTEARGARWWGDLGKVEVAENGVWIWGFWGEFGREN